MDWVREVVDYGGIFRVEGVVLKAALHSTSKTDCLLMSLVFIFRTMSLTMLVLTSKSSDTSDPQSTSKNSG